MEATGNKNIENRDSNSPIPPGDKKPMRRDMHNLIKVLPCRGGGWAKIKVPTDLEEAPLREPMKPRVRGWNLKENHDWTTPIHRYLLAQVGRPWNDVFSDICATNDNRSKNQYDVRDYVRYAVHTNIVIVDGEPQDTDGHSIWRDLWVHPDTGILMAVPAEKRYRYRGRRTHYDQVPIDATHKYVRIDGLWFLVTLAPFERAAYEAALKGKPLPGIHEGFSVWWGAMVKATHRQVIYDVVFGTGLRRDFDDACRQLRNEWGSEMFAAQKRQISKREVKKVTAQWAALEVARASA